MKYIIMTSSKVRSTKKIIFLTTSSVHNSVVPVEWRYFEVNHLISFTGAILIYQKLKYTWINFIYLFSLVAHLFQNEEVIASPTFSHENLTSHAESGILLSL